MMKMSRSYIKICILIFLMAFICSGQNIVLADNVPSDNVVVKTKDKKPDKSKNIKKMLIEILGAVSVCCGVYVAFSLYKNTKRISLDFDEKINPSLENSYCTPTDVNGAIKLFLNKLK